MNWASPWNCSYLLALPPLCAPESLGTVRDDVDGRMGCMEHGGAEVESENPHIQERL